MVSEKEVEAKIVTALAPTHLEVVDESDGCGAKFNIVVVSEQFQGKGKLSCHRLVHAAVKEEMESIHALTIHTFSPSQWAARSAAS
uniref:BolA-like protein n=1 Tax=Steinernema glaseri TaxID=37863 RepID=A0A1I8ABV3_9BILA